MADAAIHGHEHEDQRGFLHAGLCQQITKISVFYTSSFQHL